MTSYEKPANDENRNYFKQFHHITFWVGNAKQASIYYCKLFGFEPFAYRGLETGSREIVSHVIKQNNILFVFESALLPNNQEMSAHLVKHGDGVKDIAFAVDNLEKIIQIISEKDAKSIIQHPTKIQDENGSVLVAKIKTFGDTSHTLIQVLDYKGCFLPGFKKLNSNNVYSLDEQNKVGLNLIDHCVGNQPTNEMETVTAWYEDTLLFHRFWSVDDKSIHTQYSSLKSIVVTNFNETIKLPINEPANGLRKSQIQEYLDYYGGPGIQHIALNTDDIIQAVERLKKNGVEFLETPDSYYEKLNERRSNICITESIEALKKYKILLDFDDKGYLLQIFTKPLQDRPTLFIEIIQRKNHNGFGAGNFKALFEAIELEQAKRGNL